MHHVPWATSPRQRRRDRPGAFAHGACMTVTEHNRALSAKGHPRRAALPALPSPRRKSADLSHFLHQRVNDTLRGGPYSKGPQCPYRRPQSGRSLFQRRGQVQRLPLAHRRSRRHRLKVRSAHTAAAIPVPSKRRFRPRPGAACTWSKPTTVTVTPPDGRRIGRRSKKSTTSMSRCAIPPANITPGNARRI